MAYAVEDIVNMALDEAGYPQRVADIYEGSPAARVALEIYAETRDELIQSGDWPFARREVALTAVVGQTPPTPWAFEYQYPSTCLRVLYVRPGPLTGGARSNDPQPILFQVWNDNRPTPPVEAILSDTAGAVLVYAAQVTDPGTWQPNFTRALVTKLAEKFAAALTGNEQQAPYRAAQAAGAKLDGLAVTDMTVAPIPQQLASVTGNGQHR